MEVFAIFRFFFSRNIIKGGTAAVPPGGGSEKVRHKNSWWTHGALVVDSWCHRGALRAAAS